MGLQEQHIAFKFAGGVETKMDSKAVPATRLLALENGVFTRAISIKKRNGYEALSRSIEGSSTVVSGARRLAVRDAELLQFTNARCYSKQNVEEQWADAGALICATGYDRPAVHTGSQQTMPDHATNRGITAYAWEDSRGGVWWTTVDASSGRVYRAPTQAHASGQRPRCVANGEVIHIYYAVPTLQRVNVIVVNPATPAAEASSVLLIDDLDSTNPVYDVCATTKDGTPTVIAWHEHATTNVRIGFVTAGGVIGSPASGYSSVERWSLSLHATSPLAVTYATDPANGSDWFLLGYVTSGNAGRVFFMSPTIADNGGANTLYATTTSVQRVAIALSIPTSALVDLSAYAAFEEAAAQPTQRYCVINDRSVVGGSGVTGSERTLRSVGLASRGFVVNDNTFAMFVHDSTYFNTYVTLRLSDFAPVGRHMPTQASGAPARTHLSSVHVDDGVATVVLPWKTRLASTNNDKFTETALRRIVLDFDSDDSHQAVRFGAGLYMAGACPQHYDGRLWTEAGFHFGPEYLPSPTKAAGGSLTTGSTYLYRFWYEWTDAQGEIHRGPTSAGTTVTTGGSDTQVTFSLPTLRVTRKENVRVCVARSLPGDTSRLWRVTSLDPTTASDPANGYVVNSTSVDSVTFVDRMSDANLQLQEQLYTTGGILSNDPAALGSRVAVGRNRLFFTDAQVGNVVRFSQRLAPGFGLEVAPELAHDVDPVGGDITALAVMDDVVYAFKASAIFAFNGDGPFEDGGNTSGGLVSGFSSSQLITSDVGCTDPSSIALTPEGLMFKSAKGIYLLNRSRQATYIGAPVEAYNDQVVRRAVVLPDRTAVLFLTDSGSTLYYDYLFAQWSTFTNHEGYDAAVADNTLYYLRTSDVVFRETLDAHSDNGAHITLRLETAWLHLLEHLQGFQRFWKLLLLGTWASPHQLGVSYRLNYDEAWSEPYYLDATGDTDSAGWITGDSANPIGEDPILGSDYGDGVYGDGVYGGTGPDVYQWRYGIHENGQSVQFRFEDFEKSSLAGASFELTEMIIVGGVKKPDIRPFSAARST